MEFINSPSEIERRSMEIIAPHLADYNLTDDELKVYSRIIHASGDVYYAPLIKISTGAIEATKAALVDGRDVFTDVEMVRTGINKRALGALGGSVHSFEDIMEAMRKLREQGVKCLVFNPFRPLLSSIQNNRDHRKIMVIDGITSFTGGINLADEYINKRKRLSGYWKDTGVMLKGDATWNFTVMFLQFWQHLSGKNVDYEKYRCVPPASGSDIVNESDGFVQPYADNPLFDEIMNFTIVKVIVLLVVVPFRQPSDNTTRIAENRVAGQFFSASGHKKPVRKSVIAQLTHPFYNLRSRLSVNRQPCAKAYQNRQRNHRHSPRNRTRTLTPFVQREQCVHLFQKSFRKLMLNFIRFRQGGQHGIANRYCRRFQIGFRKRELIHRNAPLSLNYPATPLSLSTKAAEQNPL